MTTRMTGAPRPAVGDAITFYGADWCPDSRRSRAMLDRLDIPYRFHDLDADEAALDHARALNGGHRTVPTILLGANGSVLFEPSDDELLTALRQHGWPAVCESD